MPGTIQEQFLVAPNKEDLEQLEPQIATVRLALDGNLHEIRSLVIETIGHVEVGLGQRILLVEMDSRFAAQRVIGRAHGCRRFGETRCPHQGGLAHRLEFGRIVGVIAFLNHEGIFTRT